jgi:hypothetical protein
MPSTFTNNTFIPVVQACTTDQSMSLNACASRRGGLLDKDASGANFVAISSTDTPEDVNWVAIDPNNSLTRKGTIALQLPSDVSFSQFPAKDIEGGQNHNMGHLGLGQTSTLLQQLSEEKGLVTGFGLDAGSQSYTNPRNGYLIAGGYDRQKVGASFKNYTVANSQTSGRICSLQVTITQLVLSRPGLEDVVLISRGEQMEACIEPCKCPCQRNLTGLMVLTCR